jgi:protein-tyrosine phosphatase
MMKILFVCMGNICRSPTAEGVARYYIINNILENIVEVDSAGTHAYHVGEPPDPRSVEAALRRGIDLSGLRARKVQQADFEQFDLLLAMDRDNLRSLRRYCPTANQHKLDLFMKYSTRFAAEEVPDPYYGGQRGFDLVLDMAEDAAGGLIKTLRR